jgi:hypothetical protein
MGYGTWGFLWGERIEAQFRAGAAVRNGVGLPNLARYAAEWVLLPPEAHEFVNKSRLSKALAPKGTSSPSAALGVAATNWSIMQIGSWVMAHVDVRKGMPSVELSREEFAKARPARQPVRAGVLL